MSLDAWLTLAIIAALFTLLVIDRWPTWALFGGAVAAIVTLGLASEAEATAGFSNTGVLTVVVLYIVAAGLYRTGAISAVTNLLIGQPRTAP